MDEVIKENKKITKAIYVGQRTLEKVYILECAFRDDVVIIGRRERDLHY